MSKDKKETTQERLERMKREREAAAKKAGETDTSLVDQLTHTDSGEPDFEEITRKLRERQEQETKGENDGYVKMTIYIDAKLAAAFNALITKRGQQKEFANIAFADFVQKKIRELGIDK